MVRVFSFVVSMVAVIGLCVGCTPVNNNAGMQVELHGDVGY